jgi:hypothetical protein
MPQLNRRNFFASPVRERLQYEILVGSLSPALLPKSSSRVRPEATLKRGKAAVLELTRLLRRARIYK